MASLSIKPLSVNKAWKGQRFKTKEYQEYERDVFALLPRHQKIPQEIFLRINVGFSSRNSDVDNIAKPFIDILQKKYNFNDNQIFKLEIEKEIMKKGKEYIAFIFEEYKKVFN